mgnify:CR=1 FL=1
MKIPLLLIFSLVMTVSAWAKKALEDGKITAEEGLELLTSLAGLLGVPLEISVSDNVVEKVNEVVEVLEPDFVEANKLGEPDTKI